MTGTNLLLLILFIATVVCSLAPLSITFWHWHKELDQVRRWRTKINDPRKSLLASLWRKPAASNPTGAYQPLSAR
jgi:hypothetical protein